MVKLCHGCKLPFESRRDARTCSDRCRKRISRLRQLAENVTHEIGQEIHKIEESVAGSLQSLETNQAGFVLADDNGPTNQPQASTTNGISSSPTETVVIEPEPATRQPEIRQVRDGADLESGPAPVAPEPVVSAYEAAGPPTSVSNQLESDSLETISPSQVATPFAFENNSPKTSYNGGQPNKRFDPALLKIAASALTVTLMISLGTLFLARTNNNAPLSQNFPEQDPASTEELRGLALASTTEGAELSVQGTGTFTGDISIEGSLTLQNGGFTGSVGAGSLTDSRTYQLPDSSGEICLDSNNCGFVTEAILQTRLGSLVATTVNGSSNAVTIQGTSNQINVNTSGGTITLSTPQDINTTSSVQFGSLTLPSSGSLTLGTASTNTGSILFKGSGSANTLTLIGPTSPSTNVLLTLPNETGTLCSTGSVCTGYAPSTGGTGYIQNGTTTQANANFNIQSASSASVGAIIQGASSQTADLFQLRNSTGANLLSVSAGGNQETLGYINGPSGGIGKFSNRLIASETFSDADYWLPTVISPQNMSVTPDDGPSNPAPNGTQTADKLVSNAANAGLYQSVSAYTTGNYTFSVWLKTNSGTAPVNLRIDSTSNGITQTTGTAASFTANTTWQRLSVTQNVSGGFDAIKSIIILPNSGTTVAAWGAQTVYGTDPQVYVSTVTTPVNTQYNGVVSNGTLFATSNEGQPALILQNEYGGYLLQGINSGAYVLTINNNGTVFSNSTVTGVAGVIGGSSTLSTRSLDFQGNALDEVATITTSGGVGTGISIQADDAFCFFSCTSGGGISLGAGSGAIAGAGGNISISAGEGGSSSGEGGSVTVAGGNAASGDGGSVTIQAGTGGGGTTGAINIGTNVAASSISVGSASVAGTIVIGGTSQTGAITMGRSTAAQTINIGSANATTGAQVINIANGTTGAATTVNILSGVGTAGASTLNLANNTRVTTINLGNIAPAAARTTTIAGGNSAVVDTVNIGTGNTTVSGGKAINIGTGLPGASASNTIAIGNGGTTTGTVGITIGSIGAANHTTLIQGGNTNTSPSAAAVRLETHDSGGIAIGTNGHTGTITLGYSTSSSTINIGNGNIGSGNTQTINIGAGNPSGTGGIVLTMGATDNATSKTLIKGGTCISTQLTSCNYQAALKLIVGSAGEIQIGDNPVTGYAGVDNAVSIGSTVGNSRLTLRSGIHGIVIPSSLQGAVDSSTYLCRNSSFQLTTCSTTATGAAFIQGGNDFGANAILGTNGAGQTLAFETAGLTRLVIDTSGNAELTGNFNFTKEAARTIKINDSTTAATAGAQLDILGANGNGAVGGAIAIQGGTVNSGNFNGGAVSITGGSATGFTTGGALALTGGFGFFGGAVSLTGGTALFGPGTATLQGGNGSGTNVIGASTFISGGQGTGTGAGGSLNFRTAPAGASGSSLNSLVNRMIILVDGNVGIGDTTPAALFTVGSGDLFQVNSSGAIVAVVGITTSGDILPNAAGTIDLGSSSAEFDELYIGDNNGIKLGLDQDATLAYDEATDDRVELTGSGASMFIEDRLGFGLQTLTLTDDGTANDTLTPTATYVRVDIDETANAGVPDLVISEASAKDGDLLIIVNNEQDASHDTFTITNSAGVVHVPGGTSVTIGPNDSIMLLYMSDRWVTVSFADN